MQNLFSMLLVAFMVVLGGIPSLYILISLPGVLAQKIYGSKIWNIHMELDTGEGLWKQSPFFV